VCGKTGTVENQPRQDNAVFAAFAPCRNPRYAAVTYIEQAGLGGDSAAPVVAAVFARIATGDIDVVPTEAEADDLISESEALAAEEARLLSEAQAAAQAEAEELAANNPDGPGEFEVMVPDGSDPEASTPAAPTEPGAGENGAGDIGAGDIGANDVGNDGDDDDVLVLVPDDGEGDREP
jgi:hypothetical protein